MLSDGRFSARLSVNGENRPGPLDQGLCAIALEEQGLRFRLAGSQELYVDYAEVDGFQATTYDAQIGCGPCLYRLSWLGHELDQFLHTLWEKYNARVLSCLFAQGEPLARAEGFFELREQGRVWGGPARLRLYPDAVFVLPPGGQARRLPLCGAGIEPVRQWRFQLSYGEDYCGLSQMGRETEPFYGAAVKALQYQEQQTERELRFRLSGLSPREGESLGRALCGGRGASLAVLQQLSPTFVLLLAQRVLEENATDAAEAADAQGLPTASIIGKPGLAGLYRRLLHGLPETNLAWGLLKCQREEAQLPLWLAAWNQGRAVVEFFSDQAAATFLYEYPHPSQDFLPLLNRGLEAAGFHREIFSLPEPDLARNPAVRIALRRSPALRELRQCFKGRLIHSGPAWSQRVLEYLWPQ